MAPVMKMMGLSASQGDNDAAAKRWAKFSISGG